MFYFECSKALGRAYWMTFACNKLEKDDNQELHKSFHFDSDTGYLCFKPLQIFDDKTIKDFCKYDFDI